MKNKRGKMDKKGNCGKKEKWGKKGDSTFWFILLILGLMVLGIGFVLYGVFSGRLNDAIEWLKNFMIRRG